MVDKIVEIIPGLTAISGAASLAGLTALATKFGTFGFNLSKSSKLLGMNAQDLASWHVAAKRAGVSADQFDSAMSGSQMTIRAAAFGADPHAMMLLQKMGVQIQRNKDGTIDYYSTQQRLMKAIEGQKSVEAQRDVAGTFGMSGLLPMLQQGTYGADKARAFRKGLVPTADEVARAAQFHQDINDLDDSVTGLGNSIGSKLIPILDPLVNGFAKWLDTHRAEIADKISGSVQKLVDWLSKINWDEVASEAKVLWDNLGGVKGVAIAIAAIKFAGPIAGVLNLISSLITLTTTTIPAAASALGTLGLAGIAAWGALKVAKLAGLPDVDNKQGVEDVRNGDWLAASTHLPAGDFARALAARAAGRSNTEIASSLQGGANPAEAGAKTTLGIRSNNPLNMLDHNREIEYDTPERGIAAAVSNLERNYRGLTLAQIQDKWTGGARTGNTPLQIANYTKIMSAASGLGADVKPDLGDPRQVASIIAGMIRAENGQQPYSPEQIGNATVAGMQQGGTTVSGTVRPTGDDGHDARVAQLQQAALHVTFSNVPVGTRVEAKTPDGGYLPTKVNYAMGSMP
ncbi:hypothetical protein [Paraburkholderia bryophila]|uniref:Uncharacterized protein n=1 Tax=Paraburkholderia bryophila TaxID=420952 RepID=A0A7Y9WKE3_9BURK|nr:hypothetical protein [Paraburkholderia bryophila]NYH21383.1 hypothetical protein [Paraburkholderia bryophila]